MLVWSGTTRPVLNLVALPLLPQGNTASIKYCKTLSMIQRSDQKLEPFSAIPQVWRDQTFTSQSRDSIVTTRKMASRNTCKHSGVIQRSDQKLKRLRAVTLIWHDETSSSPSSDSMLPQGKQPPETTVNL
jgi:hypothetical protein